MNTITAISSVSDFIIKIYRVKIKKQIKNLKNMINYYPQNKLTKYKSNIFPYKILQLILFKRVEEVHRTLMKK